jgi:hypothetical protein
MQKELMVYSTRKPLTWRGVVFSDLGVLVLLALAKLAVHMLTNGQYGFHRDELGMLDDARFPAWGYVSYPPLTPFFARVALVLFGPSLVGLRFFAALGQSIVLVLVGLIARDLGGGRRAQLLAALAVAIAPIALNWSSLFHYGGFDYLWWVLIAFLAVRLLKSEDPRYWLGLGAVIGLGMLTKYTMAFCVAGLVGGVLLTRARRYLASLWLWGGVGLSLLIFLPNLVWQAQHSFIHLQFLSYIHARDIAIGRTKSFLLDQLYSAANPVTIPLWVAGLYFYFFTPAGRPFRLLGWMVVIPFALMLATQGRGYYTGPIYPALLAGGAVYGERWLRSLPAARARWLWATTWCTLALGGLVVAGLVLPVAPINSTWWQVARVVDPEPKEEIGWPELVQTVAGIYAALPPADKPTTGILTNYSEVGAISLYGPAYDLPQAIGGENTDWLRGYGDPPPQTLIVVSWRPVGVDQFFASCVLAGHITNAYGVPNEDSTQRPDIFVCHGLRVTWPDFWRQIQSFW